MDLLKKECICCGKFISPIVGPYTSHMRKHIREGYPIKEITEQVVIERKVFVEIK